MLIIGLFCAELLVCVFLNISIIYALLVGLGIFLLYGRAQGFSWPAMGKMLLTGSREAQSILIVFFLIGVLTALWRACGTLPLIICYATDLIHPGTLLLTVFLLNCAVSVLTGTSFGTAATMGAVCMTAGLSLGFNPALIGGAILSGVYFGDRCSPVSTSALLVSQLTKTNIYSNLKKMLRSSLAPFAICCLLYLLPGLLSHSQSQPLDGWALFSQELTLHWSLLLPAVLLLGLAVLRVNVKWAMLASIGAALFLCLLVQRTPLAQILNFCLCGYSAGSPDLAAILNGGGIVSMLRVAAIVCISSSYAGIFQATGLLKQIKASIARLGKRITPFGATLLTSVLTGMIACNQTLCIMLTHQLCSNENTNQQTLAQDLENTAVVVAPLIPWSIAGAVPLASAGAPLSSLPCACFLYLLPLMLLVQNLWHGKLKRRQN